MSSRAPQRKPDPAIRRNIIQARSRRNGPDPAMRAVVAGSLAATLLAWGLAAQADAQPGATLADAPAALVAPISAVAAPVVTGLEGLWTTLLSGVNDDQSESATPSGAVTTTSMQQATLATTRSSR